MFCQECQCVCVWGMICQEYTTILFGGAFGYDGCHDIHQGNFARYLIWLVLGTFGDSWAAPLLSNSQSFRLGTLKVSSQTPTQFSSRTPPPRANFRIFRSLTVWTIHLFEIYDSHSWQAVMILGSVHYLIFINQRKSRQSNLNVDQFIQFWDFGQKNRCYFKGSFNGSTVAGVRRSSRHNGARRSRSRNGARRSRSGRTRQGKWVMEGVGGKFPVIPMVFLFFFHVMFLFKPIGCSWLFDEMLVYGNPQVHELAGKIYCSWCFCCILDGLFCWRITVIAASRVKGVDLPNRRRDDYEDRGRGKRKKGGSPGLYHSGWIWATERT